MRQGMTNPSRTGMRVCAGGRGAVIGNPPFPKLGAFGVNSDQQQKKRRKPAGCERPLRRASHLILHLEVDVVPLLLISLLILLISHV